MLQNSARPKLQRAAGEEIAFQQEPSLLQTSPHGPTRQKASSGSGGGSNPGIALTGTTSHNMTQSQWWILSLFDLCLHCFRVLTTVPLLPLVSATLMFKVHLGNSFC